MLELSTINQEVLNTKTRVTIDLIKDGQEFLQRYDINENFLRDTVSIIYKFLKINGKAPHNLYKFYIAAYYIVERHPQAFPVHISKQEYCQKFGIQQSSLDYSVDKIVNTLRLVKILDDSNFPYYFDPKMDLAYCFMKKVVKTKVEKAQMNFLLYNQSLNSQILSEELINLLIFEMELFPEELFRQLYELVYDLVENHLQEYNEYINFQQKYFI